MPRALLLESPGLTYAGVFWLGVILINSARACARSTLGNTPEYMGKSAIPVMYVTGETMIWQQPNSSRLSTVIYVGAVSWSSRESIPCSKLEHQVLARILSRAFAMHILQCNSWSLIATSPLLPVHCYQFSATSARSPTIIITSARARRRAPKVSKPKSIKHQTQQHTQQNSKHGVVAWRA